MGDVRDMSSIPGSGRSPGGGHGNPLQYSCQENPMDREVWWSVVWSQTGGHDWSDLACMHICMHVCVCVYISLLFFLEPLVLKEIRRYIIKFHLGKLGKYVRNWWWNWKDWRSKGESEVIYLSPICWRDSRGNGVTQSPRLPCWGDCWGSTVALLQP